MENTEKNFEIRFYKEALFDEEQLYMEVSTDYLLSEISSHVTPHNYPSENTVMSSGTPSNTMDVSIGSAFYDIIKEISSKYSDKEHEYFTFDINTKLTTAETPVQQLETKHTVRVKNPLLGLKQEEWPKWEEPNFELPELIHEDPPKDDFTINVTPQYTDGDMWNFLDEIAHFDLTVSSYQPIKKIDIIANLMDEWKKEKLSVDVNPESKSHEIKVDISVNLLDQVKGLGSYSHSTKEKFDYFFELEITDTEDNKHYRKVSALLPNPYYQEIEDEKQVAREALAEVFRRKYNEDIAELKLESQSGWWAWKKDDASYQYGWNDDDILLYRYFGNADYDADQDEVSKAMDELTEFADGAGEFVYVDNYFVLKYAFSPEWMDEDDLEKKLMEFEEFADSEEVADFLAKYEDWN
jgi:uncharacterized ubiquitin-like protein YukD